MEMKQIKFAAEHTLQESGLHHVEPSLRAEFDVIQKAHDAIHELMLLASLCFPTEQSHEINWHNKSAFLTYQWEIFGHAHSSLTEALCTHYNVAFILLRTTLELLLKGAFWECLSHKQLRDNSPKLDKSKVGTNIKDFLQRVFEASPDAEGQLEQISAGIFDLVGHKIEEPKFRPSMPTVVGQLEEWGMFRSIPKVFDIVYKDFYCGLSADIHAVPDKTDIGRRITSKSPDLFEQQLDQASLREYATTLHKVMDVAIVVELNILQDPIGQSETSTANLSERMAEVERLELQYSLARMRELLK